MYKQTLKYLILGLLLLVSNYVQVTLSAEECRHGRCCNRVNCANVNLFYTLSSNPPFHDPLPSTHAMANYCECSTCSQGTNMKWGSGYAVLDTSPTPYLTETYRVGRCGHCGANAYSNGNRCCYSQPGCFARVENPNACICDVTKPGPPGNTYDCDRRWGQCSSCKAGYYMSGDICHTCTPGYYCKQGSTTLTLCSPGYYCPNPATQRQCTPTHYCPAKSIAENKCAVVGHYCPKGSISQTKCAAGHYCPNTSTQTACTLSHYCPKGSITQTQCAAGFYCPDTFNQNACSSGDYCPAGSTTPNKCAGGSYCLDSTQQEDCPEGHFCPEGSTSSTPCNTGKYCPLGSKTENNCDLDKYCDGGSTQTPCPVGYHCPNGILTPCPAGSYCAGGVSTPEECLPGPNCTDPEINKCKAGISQGGVGTMECKKCNIGFSLDNVKTCQPCLLSEYGDGLTCESCTDQRGCAPAKSGVNCVSGATQSDQGLECSECDSSRGFQLDPNSLICYDVDECAVDGVSPCQNGGVCANGVNEYVCSCPSQWKGRNCSVDVNECLAISYGGCNNTIEICINELGSSWCAVCDKSAFIADAEGLLLIADGSEYVEQCKYLDLSGFGIYSLSPGFFDNFTELTYLNLMNNSISNLPTGIFDNFDDSSTELLLDKETKCTSYLFSVTNGLLTRKTEPEYLNFNDCSSLNLHNNNIVRFNTHCFQDFDQLVTIVLSMNLIENITTESFSKHFKDEGALLKHVDLSYNQINTLASDSFLKLSAITELHLNRNNITTLPLGVFSDMTTNSPASIFLHNNTIQCCSSMTELSYLFTTTTADLTYHCYHNNVEFDLDNAESITTAPMNCNRGLESAGNNNGIALPIWVIIVICLCGILFVACTVGMSYYVYKKKKQENDLLEGKSAMQFVMDSDLAETKSSEIVEYDTLKTEDENSFHYENPGITVKFNDYPNVHSTVQDEQYEANGERAEEYVNDIEPEYENDNSFNAKNNENINCNGDINIPIYKNMENYSKDDGNTSTNNLYDGLFEN